MDALVLVGVLASLTPRWVAPLHGDCVVDGCGGTAAVRSCDYLIGGYVETCAFHAMPVMLDAIEDGCGVLP
jgi:hypothetical protein